jgi:hypothetical protein
MDSKSPKPKKPLGRISMVDKLNLIKADGLEGLNINGNRNTNEDVHSFPQHKVTENKVKEITKKITGKTGLEDHEISYPEPTHRTGGNVSHYGSYIKDGIRHAAVRLHTTDQWHLTGNHVQESLENEIINKLQSIKTQGKKLTAEQWESARLSTINEAQMIAEKLPADASVSDYIHDFVHSKNPRFEGKNKSERIRMALGAAYGAKAKGTKKN